MQTFRGGQKGWVFVEARHVEMGGGGDDAWGGGSFSLFCNCQYVNSGGPPLARLLGWQPSSPKGQL